jgi:hypothetical protein
LAAVSVDRLRIGDVPAAFAATVTVIVSVALSPAASSSIVQTPSSPLAEKLPAAGVTDTRLTPGIKVRSSFTLRFVAVNAPVFVMVIV